MSETTSRRGRAVCLGYELFFTVGSAGPALEHIAGARAGCARCPARDDCLERALATSGMDEDERRALQRARRRRRTAQR